MRETPAGWVHEWCDRLRSQSDQRIQPGRDLPVFFALNEAMARWSYRLRPKTERNFLWASRSRADVESKSKNKNINKKICEIAPFVCQHFYLLSESLKRTVDRVKVRLRFCELLTPETGSQSCIQSQRVSSGLGQRFSQSAIGMAVYIEPALCLFFLHFISDATQGDSRKHKTRSPSIESTRFVRFSHRVDCFRAKTR